MTDYTFIKPETLIVAGMMERDFENIIPYLLQKSRQLLIENGFINQDVEIEDLVTEIQLHHINTYDFKFGEQLDSVMRMVDAIGDWREGKHLNDRTLISNAVHKIISFGLAASGFIESITDENVALMNGELEEVKRQLEQHKSDRAKGGNKKAALYKPIKAKVRERARAFKNVNTHLTIPDLINKITREMEICPIDFDNSDGIVIEHDTMRKWLVNL